MSKLKSATRNRLPAPEVKARGRATEMERKGQLSPAQAARIRAKANRLLGRITGEGNAKENRQSEPHGGSDI